MGIERRSSESSRDAAIGDWCLTGIGFRLANACSVDLFQHTKEQAEYQRSPQ